MTRRNPTERELRLKVRETVLDEISWHAQDDAIDICLRQYYRDFPNLLFYARELLKALETGDPVSNEAARGV